MKLLTTVAAAWLAIGALGMLCFALMGVMFKVLYLGFMFGWSVM